MDEARENGMSDFRQQATRYRVRAEAYGIERSSMFEPQTGSTVGLPRWVQLTCLRSSARDRSTRHRGHMLCHDPRVVRVLPSRRRGTACDEHDHERAERQRALICGARKQRRDSGKLWRGAKDEEDLAFSIPFGCVGFDLHSWEKGGNKLLTGTSSYR